MIKESVCQFLDELQKDKHGRYISFEHFHKAFEMEYNNKKANIEYLTLHLFAYLSSWGMLRGSTFSFYKDYLFHKPVIEILLDKKYSSLLNNKCSQINNNDINNIIDVSNRIKQYYLSQTYKDSKGKIKKCNPTNALITKILLGSYQCMPALDTYVRKEIKKELNITPKIDKKTITSLLDFYNKNKNDIDDSVIYYYKKTKVNYSEMKIIDMYFWSKNFKKIKIY